MKGTWRWAGLEGGRGPCAVSFTGSRTVGSLRKMEVFRESMENMNGIHGL